MESIQVVFTGVRKVELQLLPRPSIGPEEVLLRTEHTLISPGTELAMYEGTHIALPDPENLFAKYPHRPGYAAVGRVEEIGASVKGIAVGDRLLFLGQHASWAKLNPAHALWVPVPKNVDIDVLLMARLAQISLTARYCFRRQPARCIVLGAGLIGIFAAQALKIWGVRNVVVQDVSAPRLELARRCGIERTVLAEGAGLAASVKALGAEPDGIIEATGIPGLVSEALAAIGRGGDVILLGSSRGLATIDAYKHVHRKGAALIGAHECSIPDHAEPPQICRQKTLEMTVDWVKSGQIQVAGLVTHSIRFEEIAGMYERMAHDKQGVLGVVVRWT
ncbi:MAG: zinc-binding dehydrogenase [Opitutaceae bacterium]|jgi:2-desacetyl-2-hydroxyethyl bacteriochlorophyllide A dehydrogenase